MRRRPPTLAAPCRWLVNSQFAVRGHWGGCCAERCRLEAGFTHPMRLPSARCPSPPSRPCWIRLAPAEHRPCRRREAQGAQWASTQCRPGSGTRPSKPASGSAAVCGEHVPDSGRHSCFRHLDARWDRSRSQYTRNPLRVGRQMASLRSRGRSREVPKLSPFLGGKYTLGQPRGDGAVRFRAWARGRLETSCR